MAERILDRVAAALKTSGGAPPQRDTLRSEGKRIRIDGQLLDHEPLPEYVKLSKKQITRPNGKKAWKKKPKPDPRAALDVARARGDGRGFGAVVTLKVK